MIGLQAQGTIRTGRSLWLCQWRQAAVVLTLMLLAASACQSIPAAENRHPAVVWMTSYEEALAASQQTGHPILTVFTGSDWCPHCKTLEDNVLSTEAFRSWTDAKVVLLMIDLPQAGISQAVRSERSQVCIQYGIRTFPSVLLLGPDGKRLAGQSGYNGQSATVWIAQMATHLPPPQLVEKEAETVCETLEEAVATARGSKRPILLLVSRSGDSRLDRLPDTAKRPDGSPWLGCRSGLESSPAAVSDRQRGFCRWSASLAAAQTYDPAAV